MRWLAHTNPVGCMKIVWERDVFYNDLIPVWINVSKLDASWAFDSLYIRRGGDHEHQRGKYEAVGLWISMGGRLWMPSVALDEGVVGFSDGRHRFAWLRDHRVRALPIAVPPAQKSEFLKRFGTESRSCFVPRRLLNLGAVC
jgi:hypothetical protein